MNSRNSFVRNCVTLCCNWGGRTIIPDQNYVGGPVPFLRNPAQSLFGKLWKINAVFLIIIVITFII